MVKLKEFVVGVIICAVLLVAAIVFFVNDSATRNSRGKEELGLEAMELANKMEASLNDLKQTSLELATDPASVCHVLVHAMENSMATVHTGLQELEKSHDRGRFRELKKSAYGLMYECNHMRQGMIDKVRVPRLLKAVRERLRKANDAWSKNKSPDEVEALFREAVKILEKIRDEEVKNYTSWGIKHLETEVLELNRICSKLESWFK